MGKFVVENSQFQTLFILQLIFSLVFIPLLVTGMRLRRKKYNFQGKWTVYSAFRKHRTLYISSILFYAYIIIYVWTLGFNIPPGFGNTLFYIFTGVLTLYYMILGFGIAKVGMEQKKKRKADLAASQSGRNN